MAAILLLSTVFGLPHGAQAAARDQRLHVPPNASFRVRVEAEMEQALGAPIRTLQDAINAVYFSVGWTWGAETPDALDNKAFRKAWAWGFRIEEFAAVRRESFSLDRLTEGPIVQNEGLVQPGQPSRTLAVLAAHNEDSAVLAAKDRLVSFEERVAAAREEVERISSEIAALESGSGTQRAQRSADLKVAIAELERLLNASQSSLGSMAEEVRELSQELGSEQQGARDLAQTER